MIEKYGNDAFRYFLLRESVFGLDADFREETLVNRYNGDLANNVGNLVSRTLSMLAASTSSGAVPAGDRARPERSRSSPRPSTAPSARSTSRWRPRCFNRALEAMLRATDRANKYIAETAPFTLAKDAPSRCRAWERSCTTCWKRSA